MEARRRTWFDERGIALAIDGGERRIPFYAASLQYWRTPAIRWAAALRALHGSGATIVDTYVPWRIHEPASGERLWTGARDLVRFLDLARSTGLHVSLRVGPTTTAELPSFGVPDWILADPVCQAQTSAGTPAWMPAPPRAFPIPSLASYAFHSHVRTWFAHLAEVIEPHLAPDGPIVALGIDGDSPLCLRSGAFDLDYHPDARTWWREASGLDEPPREWKPADAARCALWMKFKDEYLARARESFEKLLDEVGLAGVARLPSGMRAYASRAEFSELRRGALAHVGSASPIPLALEAGVGAMLWLPPLDTADDPTRERDQVLTLLAAGTRGVAVYEHVADVAAPWMKPLFAALAEVDWPSLRRGTPIALVATQADARYGVLTNLVDPVTPVLADMLSLGPGGAAELGTDDGAIAARRWHSAIARALELAQVPYAIVDESTSEDELARYHAVIAPTLERIDHGLFTRLRALVEHKRAVVVIGPGTPTRDELDQPLVDPMPKRVGKLKAGSLDDLPGLAEDLAALAGELPEAWHVERPDDVRAFAHADVSGTVRVVFVANDADRAVNAVLLADGRALRDPFLAETIRVADGRASIALAPHGVRMLIVES